MGYNPLYTLVENIGESGTIAQLVEHRVEAAGVGGSNPSSSTNVAMAEMVLLHLFEAQDIQVRFLFFTQ